MFTRPTEPRSKGGHTCAPSVIWLVRNVGFAETFRTHFANFSESLEILLTPRRLLCNRHWLPFSSATQSVRIISRPTERPPTRGGGGPKHQDAATRGEPERSHSPRPPSRGGYPPKRKTYTQVLSYCPSMAKSGLSPHKGRWVLRLGKRWGYKLNSLPRSVCRAILFLVSTEGKWL